MTKPVSGSLDGTPTPVSDLPMPAPRLEPTTRAFVDGLRGSTPIYTLSPEAARSVLSEAQKSVAA